MRLAKNSTAFRRTDDKYFKFNYITFLINAFIRKGFKLNAYTIISDFLFKIKIKYKKPLKLLLSEAFEKYAPLISFVQRRVAANIYHLPWFINRDRARSLVIRWFLKASLSRTENDVRDRLVNEFADLVQGYGKTVRIVEEYYNVALKSRPFMRFLRKRRRVVLNRLKKYGIR